MEYQLYNADFGTIISYCDDLLANEKLIVFNFGRRHNLVLHVYKDEEYNPEKDKDEWNIVSISVAADGKFFHGTGDVHVNDLLIALDKLYNLEKCENGVHAANIIWDTDSDDEIILPDEVKIPDDIEPDDYDAIADYLSDLTGFCVKSFSVEIVK